MPGYLVEKGKIRIRKFNRKTTIILYLLLLRLSTKGGSLGIAVVDTWIWGAINRRVKWYFTLEITGTL